MDSTFIVLVSFMIFIGIAYRLGYRRAIVALDSKIDTIRSTLQEAAQAKEAALQKLNAEHRRRNETMQEIDLIIKRAEEQVLLLRQKNLQEIEKIINHRQQEAEEIIHRFYQEAIQTLQKEATAQTIAAFEALIITDFSSAQQEALNENAIVQIGDQLNQKGSIHTSKPKRIRF